MRTLLVTSTRPYTGKSGICLALIREMQARGLSVGYFKPYGTMPVTEHGTVTDQDAVYINGHVVPPAPVEHVCPVVRTRSSVEETLAGDTTDVSARVAASFAVCAEDRDVMIVEGPGEPVQGRSLGLHAAAVAESLDARAIIVDRADRVDLPDAVLALAAELGPRCVGALLNLVPAEGAPVLRERLPEYLRARGVPVLAMLPQDPLLSSVTVAEIAERLGATVLTGEDRLDEHVESFMVGAMGQEKALRYFRRRPRKAVVTGGDRSDVQLAALETDTRCLVLTGAMPPSPIVLARADELGVPMLLVDSDTLSAVEILDSMLGRARLHDPDKADRIRRMLGEATDMDALVAGLID